MQSAYDEGMAGQDETSVEVATRLFDLLTDTLERRTRELSIGGSSTLFSCGAGGRGAQRASPRSRVSTSPP